MGIVADDEFVAYIDGNVVTSSVNFATQQLVNVTAYDSAQVSAGAPISAPKLIPRWLWVSTAREKSSLPGSLCTVFTCDVNAQVLAIDATNHNGASGLLVMTSPQFVFYSHGNGAWRCRSASADDTDVTWTDASYDDSGWQTAHSIGTSIRTRSHVIHNWRKW